MSGYKSIMGLPYCVGAVDGTHIKWPSCPENQFFEYRCYKGFASIALFAACTADRKFTYVEAKHPGVNGDAKIFKRSALKRRLESKEWLVAPIPSLILQDVYVHPYMIGDC